MFVSLFPNWTGQIQPRVVQIDGDTLQLSTAVPIRSGGKVVMSYLQWRRAGCDVTAVIGDTTRHLPWTRFRQTRTQNMLDRHTVSGRRNAIAGRFDYVIVGADRPVASSPVAWWKAPTQRSSCSKRGPGTKESRASRIPRGGSEHRLSIRLGLLLRTEPPMSTIAGSSLPRGKVLGGWGPSTR